MKIYQASIVNSLISFYGDLLYPDSDNSIYEHLNLLSIKMFEGLWQKEECLYTQINNYNPDFLGHPASSLKDKEFSLEECKHTTSNEYGFKSWEEVKQLEKTKYNIEFEQCVDAIISGNLDFLKMRLEAKPSLINDQSQYGHKATLLHYIASNGVELWRQQVPHNLAEISKLLVHFGADKEAKMNVYDGQFTTMELLTTSAHPFAAGMGGSIIEILES